MENIVDFVISGLPTAIWGILLMGMFLIVRRIYFAYKSIVEMLRNEIMEIYEKYSKTNKLTKYEEEKINRLYDLYKSLGGNGHIEVLVMRIKTGIK